MDTVQSSLSEKKSATKSTTRVKSASKVSVSSLNTSSERYVLEGYCTSDWELSPGEEAWVEKLRQEEELEMRVFGPKGDSDSTKKEKKKSSSKVNSPDSGVEEKASWLLKVFVESEQAELINLKMDNSRKESVRAMKLAWESAEPGRNEQGQATREQYLSSFDPVENPMPSVDDLIKKTRKGSRGAEPELLIADFTKRRREFEEYRVNEEKTRKERLEQVAKEYEELAEREKRILDQINFSLQLSPKPSESR